MSHCEDCGTRMSGNICPNCHEELYILTYQGEDTDGVSREFKELADEQQRQIQRKIREANA